MPIAVGCGDARGDGETVANRLDLVHVVLVNHVVQAVVKIIEKVDNLVRAAVVDELVEGDNVGKEDGCPGEHSLGEGFFLLHQIED